MHAANLDQTDATPATMANTSGEPTTEIPGKSFIVKSPNIQDISTSFRLYFSEKILCIFAGSRAFPLEPERQKIP
jgi:hypothetical protein